MKFFIWDYPYLFKYCSDKSLDSVFLTMRLGMFFHFVMAKHVEGILVGERQQPKFFNVVFIGLPYLGILLNVVRVTLDASSWVG